MCDEEKHGDFVDAQPQAQQPQAAAVTVTASSSGVDSQPLLVNPPKDYLPQRLYSSRHPNTSGDGDVRVYVNDTDIPAWFYMQPYALVLCADSRYMTYDEFCMRHACMPSHGMFPPAEVTDDMAAEAGDAFLVMAQSAVCTPPKSFAEVLAAVDIHLEMNVLDPALCGPGGVKTSLTLDVERGLCEWLGCESVHLCTNWRTLAFDSKWCAPLASTTPADAGALLTCTSPHAHYLFAVVKEQ